MNEEIENTIQKGNGSKTDALSNLADILIKTDKKNEKSQMKNLIWVKISVLISFIVLLISIFKK